LTGAHILHSTRPLLLLRFGRLEDFPGFRGNDSKKLRRNELAISLLLQFQETNISQPLFSPETRSARVLLMQRIEFVQLIGS
jgi:hypothetical protein